MARCGSWRRSTTWTAARWGSWSERSRTGAGARRPSADGSLASGDLKGGAQATVTVWLTLHLRLPDRPRMPRPKPSANAGSAELNAMVERVAPDILALLADGVPRTKPAIVEALAGRHDKQDVVHALIRLAVTEQVSESGGKFTLVQESAPDVG